MIATITEPTLSPSLFHRYLMDTVSPSMAYDGGDVAEWQARLRPKVANSSDSPTPTAST